MANRGRKPSREQNALAVLASDHLSKFFDKRTYAKAYGMTHGKQLSISAAERHMRILCDLGYIDIHQDGGRREMHVYCEVRGIPATNTQANN